MEEALGEARWGKTGRTPPSRIREEFGTKIHSRDADKLGFLPSTLGWGAGPPRLGSPTDPLDEQSELWSQGSKCVIQVGALDQTVLNDHFSRLSGVRWECSCSSATSPSRSPSLPPSPAPSPCLFQSLCNSTSHGFLLHRARLLCECVCERGWG